MADVAGGVALSAAVALGIVVSTHAFLFDDYNTSNTYDTREGWTSGMGQQRQAQKAAAKKAAAKKPAVKQGENPYYSWVQDKPGALAFNNACDYTVRVDGPAGAVCPEGTVDTGRNYGDPFGDRQCLVQCATNPHCTYVKRVKQPDGTWKCPAGYLDSGLTWPLANGDRQCYKCPMEENAGNLKCSFTGRKQNAKGKWWCPKYTLDVGDQKRQCLVACCPKGHAKEHGGTSELFPCGPWDINRDGGIRSSETKGKPKELEAGVCCQWTNKDCRHKGISGLWQGLKDTGTLQTGYYTDDDGCNVNVWSMEGKPISVTGKGLGIGGAIAMIATTLLSFVPGVGMGVGVARSIGTALFGAVARGAAGAAARQGMVQVAKTGVQQAAKAAAKQVGRAATKAKDAAKRLARRAAKAPQRAARKVAPRAGAPVKAAARKAARKMAPRAVAPVKAAPAAAKSPSVANRVGSAAVWVGDNIGMPAAGFAAASQIYKGAEKGAAKTEAAMAEGRKAPSGFSWWQ